MDFANFKINLLSCTSYLHPTLVHSARHFLRHSKMSFISSFPLECNRTLRVQSCWNVWNLLSTNLTIISPIWNILSRSARNSLVSVIHCTYIFAASYSASMPRPERTYTSWRTKPINRWHTSQWWAGLCDWTVNDRCSNDDRCKESKLWHRWQTEYTHRTSTWEYDSTNVDSLRKLCSQKSLLASIC